MVLDARDRLLSLPEKGRLPFSGTHDNVNGLYHRLSSGEFYNFTQLRHIATLLYQSFNEVC